MLSGSKRRPDITLGFIFRDPVFHPVGQTIYDRFSMGCKGPRSACDSFERKWNNGVNWCVNNATCIGCTSPTFPDGQSPFYVN